jgi:hypothetical protein
MSAASSRTTIIAEHLLASLAALLMKGTLSIGR